MSCINQIIIIKVALIIFISGFFNKNYANPSFQSSLIKLNNKQKLVEPSIIKSQNHYNFYLENKLVKHYIKLYSQGTELLNLIKRSKHLFQHVINELEKKNLPKELALLPIVESEYRPWAKSKKGATGVWQISYITGKHYGLIYTLDNNLYDNRENFIASTKVALSYLEFLYKKFNYDWLLALAAYNAGEGRIIRAIKKHYNNYNSTSAAGQISYWSLSSLPDETKHYIPKLLALLIIFNNPKQFGLNFNDI